MSEMDFKTFINGVGNDFKIAIDDLIGAILTIHDDVEKLKVKTSKPTKTTAKGLLEYIVMEDGKAKEAMKAVCGKEIEQYLKWVDAYCKEYCFAQEEVLNKIIEGKI